MVNKLRHILKSGTGVVLAGLIALSSIPSGAGGHALAASPKEISEEETNVITLDINSRDSSSPADGLDNDELFAGYVDQLFNVGESSQGGTLSYNGRNTPRRNTLSGRNLRLYDALKAKVSDVAAGNIHNTKYFIHEMILSRRMWDFHTIFFGCPFPHVTGFAEISGIVRDGYDYE